MKKGKRMKHIKPEQKAKAFELLQNGVAPSEVAKQTRISRGTVYIYSRGLKVNRGTTAVRGRGTTARTTANIRVLNNRTAFTKEQLLQRIGELTMQLEQAS